jgi:CheY-like chemotaxis protein
LAWSLAASVGLALSTFADSPVFLLSGDLNKALTVVAVSIRYRAKGSIMIRLHVLVVDDETANRAFVEAALSPDPFFVLHDCASGAEALTAALAWRPDLILLDTVMPNMDGPTVLRRLRADKRTAPISVLFATLRGDLSERQRLTKLGAAGVIIKPFDPPTLAAQIRGFVAAEGILLSAREAFLGRLKTDANALLACRTSLMQRRPETALMRIKKDRTLIGRRRRHLRVCRDQLRVCGAVRCDPGKSRRAGPADRCGARHQPPAGAHRHQLVVRI